MQHTAIGKILTMNYQLIEKTDISDLENQVFDQAGKLIIKPFEYWEKIPLQKRLYFLHKHAFYVLPTTELIEWLKTKISGLTIEIGAGHGAIGRALNIPVTDSYLQNRPDIILTYQLGGQPVIKYPPDVEKLEALEAIKKYNPETVVGGFITHRWVNDKIGGNSFGPQEEEILKNVPNYIHIGNLAVHGQKPILKYKYNAFYFPWLITRAVNQNLNVIFQFNNTELYANRK